MNRALAKRFISSGMGVGTPPRNFVAANAGKYNAIPCEVISVALAD